SWCIAAAELCEAARSGQLARAHGSAVGADLGPVRPELGRVEAKRDHRVAAASGRFFDQAPGRVLAPVGEHLRHPFELTPAERLQSCADLRAEVARADGEAEHLAQHLLDL